MELFARFLHQTAPTEIVLSIFTLLPIHSLHILATASHSRRIHVLASVFLWDHRELSTIASLNTLVSLLTSSSVTTRYGAYIHYLTICLPKGLHTGKKQATLKQLTTLFRKTPHLNGLSLETPTLADLDLITIATCLPHLTRLTLISSSLSQVLRIADASLKSLPRTLTQLTIPSDSITDWGLSHLPNTLTYLDLTSQHLTDAGIASLARRCLGLKTLRLCSPLLTDSVMASLPPAITEVDFTSFQISDEGVETLVQRCRSLKRIALSSVSITDKSLLLIVKFCVGIERIYFNRNCKVSGELVERMCFMIEFRTYIPICK